MNYVVRHCVGVYPPAEDSYQTCTAIDFTVSILRRRLSYVVRALDVGSGTGILTIHMLHRCFQDRIKCHIIAIDVSEDAAKCTLMNIRLNSLDVYADVVVCDVDSCLRESLRVDVIVSNPPYLPEEIAELCDPTYCGGPEGRQVIDRVVKTTCRRRGILLLTQSSLSDPQKTVNMLATCNCDVVLVGQNHILFEDIVTLLAICY